MKKITILVLMLFTAQIYAQDIELNGAISAEDNQIKNLQDPTEAQDVVTLSVLLEKISALQDQIDNAGIGSITDVDGNTYNSLTYGNQAWTVENAEVVTYRDGTSIPQVTANDEWESLTTGAWCYYENDETKPRLYNWYAVMGIHDPASLSNTSQRKEFAPEGWHVPSDAEWTTLEEYLIANEYNYDGTITGNKIAKAMSSTTGWNSSTTIGAVGNNQSLNNDSGFNVFPEGYRNVIGGSFNDEGDNADFWSSTELNTDYAWGRNLASNASYLYTYYGDKQGGFSVRFVRDGNDLNDFVGSWVLNTRTQDGIELTDSSYLCSKGNEMYTFEENMTFDFIGHHSNVAGDCEINTSDVYSGTYAIESNLISVTYEGENESASYEIINNQLIFTTDSDRVSIYDKN
ncbi:fibrobacter succinogenes major paralogous domain-containing protein [bacterium]|nr:fibrobacter succinogenes major paralogous domain-containing protein [bacterium]